MADGTEQIQTIHFTPWYPCEDYDVEDFYQRYKEDPIIGTSNELVLLRFRVGIAEGEIPPARVVVWEKHCRDEFEFMINEDGRYVHDVPNSILDYGSDLLQRLLEAQWSEKND